MNIQEYRELRAEKSTLESLLHEIPESSVIERTGLEVRKKEVEELLSSQPSPAREPAHARLLFRGKPVAGSHGVFAEFAAKAVSTFVEAVAAIGASQTTSLGKRGAIPGREEYQLLLTATAAGSFGFELEEAPREELVYSEMSSVESALEQTKSIMEATVGTDDELTEAISEADPRAVEALVSFLKTIADHEAVCALEFKDEVFRFADVGQIRRSQGRLSQDNIHEKDIDLVGRFLGVLPNRRTFEFQPQESQEVVFGRIGPDIGEAAEINLILNEAVKIKVHTKQAGSGRPRYVLLDYEQVAG